MQMTTHEIVQMYKEAADKNAQIGILADLNACKKEEILTILQEEGLLSGVKGKKQEKKAGKKMVWTEETKERVRLLLSEGMTVLEVAERMGLDAVQVRNAVTRFKLRKSSAKEEKKEMPTKQKKRMPIDCVSLIRDYAKCIVLLPPQEIKNYAEIVGVFASSIMEAADEILDEAKKYAK